MKKIIALCFLFIFLVSSISALDIDCYGIANQWHCDCTYYQYGGYVSPMQCCGSGPCANCYEGYYIWGWYPCCDSILESTIVYYSTTTPCGCAIEGFCDGSGNCINPSEKCYDGKDNDCDGQIDEVCCPTGQVWDPNLGRCREQYIPPSGCSPEGAISGDQVCCGGSLIQITYY